MTLNLSITTDKDDYAPGEAVQVTAKYASPSSTFTVNLTGTVQDDAGNVATAAASYTVTPPGTPVASVAVSDDQGAAYVMQSNAGGVATLAGVAPASGLHITSGYGGTEPTPAQAGGGLVWDGHTWELENWGTGPGQPKASQVQVDTSGAMVLSASTVAGVYAGAEVDSARGDAGIASNPLTWGYGTYRWVVEEDLTTLPPGLVLGFFTFWAANKGGTAGQKEIDLEFYSAGTIPGARRSCKAGSTRTPRPLSPKGSRRGTRC